MDAGIAECQSPAPGVLIPRASLLATLLIGLSVACGGPETSESELDWEWREWDCDPYTCRMLVPTEGYIVKYYEEFSAGIDSDDERLHVKDFWSVKTDSDIWPKSVGGLAFDHGTQGRSFVGPPRISVQQDEKFLFVTRRNYEVILTMAESFEAVVE